MYEVGKISGVRIFGDVDNATDANILTAIVGCMNDARSRFGWRDASELVPEEPGNVLGWVPGENGGGHPVICYAHRHFDGKVRWYDKPGPQIGRDIHVTHWMQLPPGPLTTAQIGDILAANT